ncbi:MAG: hypothetical protein AB7F19_03470 [Candidatus Babeliales bacterium]
MNINFISILLVVAIAFILSKFYEEYVSNRNALMLNNTHEYFTPEHREKLMKQFTEEFRRIVLRNEMNQNIELTFLLKQDGNEDFSVQHYIGANDSGQVPYFVPGVLYVTHDKNTASVDISDITKEYIFTVHSDGSVSQVSQTTRELKAENNT